jgi:3-oxoacyl-[acyl-carrier-protein] synthase II
VVQGTDNRVVVVTGMGLVTALGQNRPTTWQRLLAGQSGLQLRQPFPNLPVVPLGMVGKHPAKLTDLLTTAIDEAMADAGLVPPLPDCGVVVGSSRSFQGEWERQANDWLAQKQVPDGEQWLASMPAMVSQWAARQIGATGVVLAPMAACATGSTALFQAWNLIRSGQCDLVIAGAVEAPITPLTLTGFRQMKALAPTGCYPFDDRREGLVLAEGAAIFVLESAESWQQRGGTRPYGTILGGGLRADAHHMNAPNPDLRGSQSGLMACLQHSGINRAAVGYIHAHGTGTVLNDSHEAQLVTNLFPHLPLMSSTKGATGHTLGASGALGAAFCLLALQQQVLPPNVGLGEDPIYPALVQQATLHPLEVALAFSFGFGGQNAVLAFEHRTFLG